MDLASVVAALASVGVRVSGSTPNNNIQGDSSRACPTGLAGPEPSGTHNDPGQHFQCFVQRRRSGACLAWCRGIRHCCVAVPKSRGRGADVPWLVRWCVGALLGVGVVDGRPRGGRFPALRGASGVRRCPSPGRPSSGAGSQGSVTHVSRVRSVRAWGSSTGPTACALAGRRCSLWGWRKSVPGGGRLSPW